MNNSSFEMSVATSSPEDHVYDNCQPLQQQDNAEAARKELKLQLSAMDRKLHESSKRVKLAMFLLGTTLLAGFAATLALVVHQNGDIKGTLLEMQTAQAQREQQIRGDISSLQSAVNARKEQDQLQDTRARTRMTNLQNTAAQVPESLKSNFAELKASQKQLEIFNEYGRSEIDLRKMTKFHSAMSKAAVEVFSGMSNFYRFDYDGGTSYIYDGGNDMYDHGNRLRFWKGTGGRRSVTYNQTYMYEGPFMVSSTASHPFVLTMTTGSRQQRYQQLFFEEQSNLGASGKRDSRNYRSSFTEGFIRTKYACYRAYGSSPSVIQIFLDLSSTELFQSTGSSELNVTIHENDTQTTRHTAELHGNFSNHYFAYILMSQYPGGYGYWYYMRSYIRDLVRSFQSFYLM